MNKFYLSLLSATVLATGAIAQTKTQQPISHRVKPTLDAIPHTVRQDRGGVAPIWSDDFSDPSNWVIDHAPSAPDLDWQIGIGLTNQGSFPTAPIESTTASNGYAMLDSDGFGNESLVESSYMTTADPIDLSAVDNVVLQFESFYRKWTSEECYIVISTNNTDWPALTPTTDISAMPNVFKAWPGMAVQAVISNPTLVRINITAAAANQQQVWVRFHWTGTYGYSWFVDDVSVIEQPANDIVLNTSYLSHTGNGEEYGRIPSSQLNPTMLMGGEVFNFGYAEQTDIELTLEVMNASDVVVFGFEGSASSIATTDTVSIEDAVTLPSLPLGIYRGITTVTSALEQDGPFFTNNTHLRNFEINDDVYSLDGIGVHPEENQATLSLGTNSIFDGLMLFTYYEVIAPLDVYGIEFLIRTNGRTLPGASVIAALHDTTDVLALPDPNVSNALVVSDLYDVTEADTTAGVVRIYFDEAYQLEAGGYYAGLELFSGDSTYPIYVINDLTVPQPSLASVIYDPTPAEETVFSNGNALAIRLLLSAPNSVGDETVLQGVDVYPNPSNGILNIRTAQLGRCTVEVFNVLGENVLATSVNGNTALDMSSNPAGVYMVRISNGNATMTQRVVLN